MSLDFSVKKDFGGFRMDLELHAENEILALLGASGSGKSMTLRCIAGIEHPDEGRIVVNGVTLFDSEKGIDLSPQERHVGLLFQNYALFPNMTVEQNILTGMNAFSISRKEKREKCHEMMERFYLNGLEKHRPAQLSGGQQQRVALARIMVSRPRILMLDEPFSALDSFLRWELEQELMKVLEDYEGTSLIVSHNRDEVYRISDHIAVIDDGRVDCYGRKEEIFQNPETYQSALLTGCRNFSRASRVDDHHVKAEDWNAVLSCPAPPDVKYVALRPNLLRVTSQPGENTVEFRIEKVIENLTEMILLLSSEGGTSEYSRLNIRITKENWMPYQGAERIFVRLEDDDLLLLNR